MWRAVRRIGTHLALHLEVPLPVDDGLVVPEHRLDLQRDLLELVVELGAVVTHVLTDGRLRRCCVRVAREQRELGAARERLIALERQRQRLMRLYQLDEIDDGYLQRETAAIRTQRASLEAAVERLSGAGAIGLPDSPEDFAATCAAVRSRIVPGVTDGNLERIAKGLQLSVRVRRTDEGTSGVLEGVIPHSPDENFPHHWTNIGMNVQL